MRVILAPLVVASLALAGGSLVASVCVALALAWLWDAHRRARRRDALCREMTRIAAFAPEYAERRGWRERDLGLVADHDVARELVLAFEATHRTLAAAASARKARLDALADTGRLRMEFIAMVSHDLRSPLNTITGFAELLREGVDGPLTPAQRSSVDAVRDAADGLLALVGGVLDCARMEAGLLDVHPRSESVAAWAGDAVAAAMSQVQTPVRLKLPSRDETAEFDRERLRQALVSVVVHAAKFTGDVVRVSVEQEPETFRLRIASARPMVSDEEDAFVPFRAVRDDAGRRIPGLGFGLALARGIAAAHSGALTYGADGGGSEFVFELPRAQAQRSATVKVAPSPGADSAHTEPPH